MDLSKPYLYESWQVEDEDRPFEFFMNQFRLREPCDKQQFIAYSGLQLSKIESAINTALEKKLIEDLGHSWLVTNKGHRFLNDLLELFV